MSVFLPQIQTLNVTPPPGTVTMWADLSGNVYIQGVGAPVVIATGSSFDPSAPGPIGASVPDSGAFTTLTANTLNGITINVGGEGTALFQIANGKTVHIANSLEFTGVDGSTLNISDGTVLSNIASAVPAADGTTSPVTSITIQGGIVTAIS